MTQPHISLLTKYFNLIFVFTIRNFALAHGEYILLHNAENKKQKNGIYTRTFKFSELTKREKKSFNSRLCMELEMLYYFSFYSDVSKGREELFF
jgi:hypothetical protein